MVKLLTVEYVAGQHADVHIGRRGGPAVLLWHGRGPNEREVLAPLADSLARAGFVVFVPDWRSDAADGGKAHLLASLAWMAGQANKLGADLGRWALVGWSLGGRCALGMLFARPSPSLPPVVTMAIAASTDAPDPVFGVSVIEAARNQRAAGPVVLVHGVRDTIVPIDHARHLQQVWQHVETPAELHELPTDHAGVVGTVYDPEQMRCVPSTDSQPLRAVRLVTAVLENHLVTSKAGCSR